MAKSIRKEERWWSKIREILNEDLPYEMIYFKDDDDKELIYSVMEDGGTISLYGDGKIPYIYHIHFPYYTPSDDITPLPMCSCMSYRYQSFSDPIGACKHIHKVFTFVGKEKEYMELPWYERSEPHSPWTSF